MVASGLLNSMPLKRLHLMLVSGLGASLTAVLEVCNLICGAILLQLSGSWTN